MLQPAKKYLKINNYSHAASAFEDAFMSHPNYPSLYALTDSLTLNGIENIAVKIQKEQLEELPLNFLTFFKNELVLVYKNSKTITIEDEKGQRLSLSSESFTSDWNPIIIAIEPDTTGKAKAENFNKSIIPLLLISSILLGSFFIFNVWNITYTISMLITLAGVVTSIMIAQEKLGIKSDLSSKICSLNTSNTCNSVILSEKGNLTNNYSFTDLCLLFFTTNFFALVLGASMTYSLVILTNLMALPVIVYSIYLQKYVLKKWCPLCLLVSVLILSQSLLATFNTELFTTIPTSTGLLIYCISVLSITAIWSLLSPFLTKYFKVASENNELKRFKKNYKVYDALAKPQKNETERNMLKGIHFGNTSSPMVLSLFLSPSCGHCHKAFQDALNIVHDKPNDIYLSVLFNVNPSNEENPYLEIVKTLIEINANNPLKAQEALKDWHIDRLTLEDWLKKWKRQEAGMITLNEIHKQYHWCLENDFNYTPVKIVNHQIFPEVYQLEELKYFITDIKEANQEITDTLQVS